MPGRIVTHMTKDTLLLRSLYNKIEYLFVLLARRCRMGLNSLPSKVGRYW